MKDFKSALDNVSASSAGGAPFLIAYGTTFLITAILSYFLPRSTVALIAMFQGGLALPVSFLLERRMAFRPRDRQNPLNELSGQIAMSQAFGLPALIVAYSLDPGAIPVVLASLGGVHFFPYAWLHRTRAYMALGGIIAVGAFVLQIVFGADAFHYNLFLVAIAYWVAVPLVYRNAKTLVGEAAA
jgi:hypothetical protein